MPQPHLLFACWALVLTASAAAAQPTARASTGGSPVFVSAVRFSAPSATPLQLAVHADTMPENRRLLGLRGGVLGALIGIGAGLVAVRVLCDVEDCANHPDTKKIMIGATAVGALGGFLLDHAWHAIKRDREP